MGDTIEVFVEVINTCVVAHVEEVSQFMSCGAGHRAGGCSAASVQCDGHRAAHVTHAVDVGQPHHITIQNPSTETKNKINSVSVWIKQLVYIQC